MKKILQIGNLTVSFPVKKNFFGNVNQKIIALNKVNLDVNEGEVIGIVGESGCGKTTLAKTIIGLNKIEKGSIIFDEKFKLHKFKTHSEWKDVRKDIQIIFQDPFSSLDPMMRIEDILLEPINTFFPNLSYEEKEKKISEIVTKVCLNHTILYRFPHELSGGQCQRINIARALVTEPKLLICDESISALDLSVQAQIINLLKTIQKEMNLSMIFISHNLSVVKYLADRVTVMYMGDIVEQASSKNIFLNQYHPYTKALVNAIPPLLPDEQFFHKATLPGYIHSSINPPSGCPFRTRCKFVKSKCIDEKPSLNNIDGPVRYVACHFPLKDNIDKNLIL